MTHGANAGGRKTRKTHFMSTADACHEGSRPGFSSEDWVCPRNTPLLDNCPKDSDFHVSFRPGGRAKLESHEGRGTLIDLIPGRLALNNRVIAASGTFGYGTEFAGRMDAAKIGAIVGKGITLEPRAGHPPPRILETAAGVLNAIGLANVGAEAAIAGKAPAWATAGTPIVININGESVEDYVTLAKRFTGVSGVSALELNISCPNVSRGGIAFGLEPEAAAEVTRATRAATTLPLIVKLTPNARDIVAVATAVTEAGAEALTVANTYLGLAINLDRRRTTLTNVTGGLSGPAIKPLTLRLVYEIAAAVRIPIIGCGGVMRGEDAVEYLMAGASAVQVGTASLVDPFSLLRIGGEIAEWLRRNGHQDASDIVGSANPAFRRR